MSGFRAIITKIKRDKWFVLSYRLPCVASFIENIIPVHGLYQPQHTGTKSMQGNSQDTVLNFMK